MYSIEYFFAIQIWRFEVIASFVQTFKTFFIGEIFEEGMLFKDFESRKIIELSVIQLKYHC